MNTCTFWSSHLNLLQVYVTSLSIFHLHEVLCIENLASFSIRIFSRQFISGKIYHNKVASLEHFNADMLVLKMLGQCYKWFGLVYLSGSTILARGVFLNGLRNLRRCSCSVKCSKCLEISGGACSFSENTLH